MGLRDDAEETPVAYGPTPGRDRGQPAPSALRAELAYIRAEIDAWARNAFGAHDGPPDALFQRQFEICQLLGVTLICGEENYTNGEFLKL